MLINTVEHMVSSKRDQMHELIAKHINDLEESVLETMWLTIIPCSLPREYSILVIRAIYHTPKPTPDSPMLQHIYKSLDTLLQKHPDAAIFLIGDFNTLDDRYLRQSYKLKQIFKKPTKGNNILDKVYTNVAHLYSEPDVLPPLGSLPHGHGVVICQPCTVPYKHDQKYTVEVCRSDRNSKTLFAYALQKTRWEELDHKDSCHKQFEYFQMSIENLLDTNMPKQLVTRNINDKPWITPQFKQLIMKRQWAHSKGQS
jgi:hypothetical protein